MSAGLVFLVLVLSLLDFVFFPVFGSAAPFEHILANDLALVPSGRGFSLLKTFPKDRALAGPLCRMAHEDTFAVLSNTLLKRVVWCSGRKA